MKKEFLECGKIVCQHGVRGAVKVESWCDTPRALSELPVLYLADKSGGFSPLTPGNASVYKGFVLFSFKEISSADEAIALRGRTVYARRRDLSLPPGRVFLQDLVGLPVKDARTGVLYGTLREIRESPAAPLLAVETPRGEVLLPDVPAFVERKDADAGIFVTPIPGFFDGAAENVAQDRSAAGGGSAALRKEKTP